MNSIATNPILNPRRVVYRSDFHISHQPNFEEWPVSQTYRKSAETLINASVGVLDALGKQGTAHELRQLLNDIESGDEKLSATALSTIANVRSYLDWFETPRQNTTYQPVENEVLQSDVLEAASA